jgi:hypothetical protein
MTSMRPEVTMASRRSGATRGLMAAVSAALAAGVAVLVNVLTSGWPWAAGAGLAALVVCQGGLEWLRSSRDRAPESSPRAGPWSVVQRIGRIVGGGATGVRSPPPGAIVKVFQWFGSAKNADIVGIDGDPGRKIPGRSADPQRGGRESSPVQGASAPGSIAGPKRRGAPHSD